MSNSLKMKNNINNENKHVTFFSEKFQIKILEIKLFRLPKIYLQTCMSVLIVMYSNCKEKVMVMVLRG